MKKVVLFLIGLSVFGALNLSANMIFKELKTSDKNIYSYKFNKKFSFIEEISFKLKHPEGCVVNVFIDEKFTAIKKVNFNEDAYTMGVNGSIKKNNILKFIITGCKPHKNNFKLKNIFLDGKNIRL